MKTAIWRYQLIVRDTQTLMMPEGAIILTVQTQNEQGICLWALVHPEAAKQSREIEIIGTGNPMPVANRRYISTVQLDGGVIVLHVFERE